MEVVLEVWRDQSGSVQTSIGEANGIGYRISGPKFSGRSTLLSRYVLTSRDVQEIRRWLDEAEVTDG